MKKPTNWVETGMYIYWTVGLGSFWIGHFCKLKPLYIFGGALISLILVAMALIFLCIQVAWLIVKLRRLFRH